MLPSVADSETEAYLVTPSDRRIQLRDGSLPPVASQDLLPSLRRVEKSEEHLIPYRVIYAVLSRLLTWLGILRSQPHS